MPAVKTVPASTVMPAVHEENLLDRILENWGRPESPEEEEVVDQGLEDILALLPEGELGSIDPEALIRQEIQKIDAGLNRQLNLILHEPKYARIEATWRGLHYLVSHGAPGANLSIALVPVSRADLEADARKVNGKFRQSRLFKRLVENELGTAGGRPVSMFVCDHEFTAGAADIDLLKRYLAPIAAEAHAPLVGGVSPAFFGCKNFTELPSITNLGSMLTESVTYAGWRSLRELPESRYLGLVMPRMLARSPYQRSANASGFQFEEDVNATDPSTFLWTSAVYGFATRVAASLSSTGWFSVQGKHTGGRCDDLPSYIFHSRAGRPQSLCPTEVQLTDAKEAELAAEGFISLVRYQHENYAVFYGAPSVHRPKKSTDVATQADLLLAAKLPHVLASGRFAHHLAVMFRDMIGSRMDPSQVEQFLNQWIQGYTLATPETATDDQKARYPLRSAKVVVEPVPGAPGHYKAAVELVPHYQIEEITCQMTLRAVQPTQK